MRFKLTVIAMLAILCVNTVQAATYYCRAECRFDPISIVVSANTDTEAANKTNNRSLIEQACKKARNTTASQSGMKSGDCFREDRNSSSPKVYVE